MKVYTLTALQNAFIWIPIYKSILYISYHFLSLQLHSSIFSYSPCFHPNYSFFTHESPKLSHPHFHFFMPTSLRSCSSVNHSSVHFNYNVAYAAHFLIDSEKAVWFTIILHMDCCSMYCLHASVRDYSFHNPAWQDKVASQSLCVTNHLHCGYLTRNMNIF